MGAIPKSNMPGHQRLHELVVASLDRCQETQAVEFKRSERWENLKAKIAKTALAMGNLRDGGVVIMGVEQAADTWNLTGIYSDDLASYDVDDVAEYVNLYASPHVDLDIVTAEHDGKTYLAIAIREFADTPLVCRKGGQENLEPGGIYIRTHGMVKTKKVATAEEMRDLLELAAEKRARRILEVASLIGLEPVSTSKQRFDKELGGLL